jgi:RNA polymerase sigma-70 factor, ECF subfamily
MHEASDGQLLRAWRKGDAGAFSELVRRHQTAMLQHARAVLGAGAAYEDAVQEAFLRLAQSPPEVPKEAEGDERLERAHFLSWLHTVTRNCCMDTLRSEARRRRREHEVASDEAAEGGLSRVEARDTRAAVKRELELLPTDQREVLVLRLLGERSYKEIAEITGKKIGTVGWLISVGLRALEERLQPLMGIEGTRKLEAATSPSLDAARGKLRGEVRGETR